jgi:hypothetical protein
MTKRAGESLQRTKGARCLVGGGFAETLRGSIRLQNSNFNITTVTSSVIELDNNRRVIAFCAICWPQAAKSVEMRVAAAL